MYSGGSVVGKASTIGPEISFTPPLLFIGVKKFEIWLRFKHHLNLSRLHLKIQQDILILKQTSCVVIIALCPRQVWCSWVYAPWEPSVSCAPPPSPQQLHGESVLNRQ